MSRALTNTMSSIAYADGLMLYYMHHYKPGKETMDLVNEVRDASSECFKHWERFLHKKNFKEIYDKMKSLEDKILVNRKMPCYTSFVIDMVETLRSYISDQARYKSLTRLLNALEAFHNVVDDGDMENYETGAIASAYWNEVLSRV